MGTRTVRLEEDVYERVRAHKREDETFSEAIDRLTSEYSLLDFAGDTPRRTPSATVNSSNAPRRRRRPTARNCWSMGIDVE